MEIKFVNITEKDFLSTKLLHKYMPLEYALRTLNNNELWFANPIKWKDPFEKRFIEARYINGSRNFDFPWKNRVFCICMTENTTSEAYWNTYTQQQIGIEFKILKKELLKELERHSSEYDIYIGKVEYMKPADIKRSISKIPFATPEPVLDSDELYARLLLLKRNAYKFEDEIRIIIVKENETSEPGFNLKYRCLNTDLFDSITLDPSLLSDTTSLLKEIFESKYKFTSIPSGKGFKHRVMKSQLYAEQKPQTIKY